MGDEQSADQQYATQDYAGQGYATQDDGSQAYADQGYSGQDYGTAYADQGYADHGYADQGYAGQDGGTGSYGDPAYATQDYGTSAYGDPGGQDYGAVQYDDPSAYGANGDQPQDTTLLSGDDQPADAEPLDGKTPKVAMLDWRPAKLTASAVGNDATISGGVVAEGAPVKQVSVKWRSDMGTSGQVTLGDLPADQPKPFTVKAKIRAEGSTNFTLTIWSEQGEGKSGTASF